LVFQLNIFHFISFQLKYLKTANCQSSSDCQFSAGNVNGPSGEPVIVDDTTVRWRVLPLPQGSYEGSTQDLTEIRT